VSVLEAIASCRAQNGATPLAAARAVLDAVRFADDGPDDFQLVSPAGGCAAAAAWGGKGGGGDGLPSRRARSLDKSYALARLLGCVGEVCGDTARLLLEPTC
jgi:hypothetical protein